VVLDGKLVITGGGAKQEVSEAVSGETLGIRTLERECSLGRPEKVLDFLVSRPASADLQLVRTFGPGDVVADLVTVSAVDPRPAGDLEVRIALMIEGDVGNAIQVIRPREQAGVAEVAGR